MNEGLIGGLKVRIHLWGVAKEEEEGLGACR